ncbi:MAPK regulated corepressor interacting protein 2-like isoform X5 [Pseudomyrmex gracilis]|uniref:MAPK regulated corepressor interacting protein 2-like isoform X5 n=1 Tax=Pseudomyrmex gracilis TaxID=219809 RepID=UPI000994C5A4|nr:MAPK regulated corepressor interacting protein 2-like isoform X5 [Pseudomyrmex gracilis]
MNRTIYIRSVSRERAHKITPVSRSQTTMTTMNGKKPSSIPSKHQSEAVTQHSWNSVSRELDMSHSQSHSNSSNHKNGATVTYYQEHEPNPHLKNFKPFNLEAYWGQRVVQTITRNSKS